ncbi:MAG: hypothetical protein ABI682_00920 [Acidobacteriota bacterium]
MPEYLYPGVYLEETSAPPSPIPGVPTSTGAFTLEALRADLEGVLRAHVPDWTGGQDSDPGVTIVELFAFLAETLLSSATVLTDEGRGAARRASAALSALAGTGAHEPACRDPLTRPVFFSGRLLDPATLTAEQNYHREKLRRHNRALLGYGTVSGLEVRVDDAGSGPASIAIEPGLAIDRAGEEISLPCALCLPLPADGDAAFVSLRFWEHPSGLAGEIEEACLIAIHPHVAPGAVPLARLLGPPGGWRVDPDYERPRVAKGS